MSATCSTSCGVRVGLRATRAHRRILERGETLEHGRDDLLPGGDIPRLRLLIETDEAADDVEGESASSVARRISHRRTA